MLTLVVGRSSVNRIVITRIVAQRGLVAWSEPPETAVAAAVSRHPELVILDAGADGEDTPAMMAVLAQIRELKPELVPRFILLSPASAEVNASPPIDAVVRRPILPETIWRAIAEVCAGY